MLLSLHATLLDPDSPSKSHQSDSYVLASGTLKPSPTALFLLTGLKLLWGGTSPLRPTVFPVYASRSLFIPLPELRGPRNTRYGLLVKLYPIGTSYLDTAWARHPIRSTKLTCRKGTGGSNKHRKHQGRIEPTTPRPLQSMCSALFAIFV